MLRPAPVEASLKRIKEKCMGGGLTWGTISPTFEKHLERLEAILSRLKQHSLKQKPVWIFQSRGDLFGAHSVWRRNPYRPKQARSCPEMAYSKKKNIKEVRSYLGVTGYYWTFIWYYAKNARLLIDLLVGHCTFFCYFPMLYPGSGVVFDNDCIVSWSLPSFLLSMCVLFNVTVTLHMKYVCNYGWTSKMPPM